MRKMKNFFAATSLVIAGVLTAGYVWAESSEDEELNIDVVCVVEGLGADMLDSIFGISVQDQRVYMGYQFQEDQSRRYFLEANVVEFVASENDQSLRITMTVEDISGETLDGYVVINGSEGRGYSAEGDPEEDADVLVCEWLV